MRQNFAVFFVNMRPWTPAYEDFRRLAELAGFSFRDLSDVDLSATHTYIFWLLDSDAKAHVGLYGSSRRRARVVLWNIERAFHFPSDSTSFESLCRDEWLAVADEVWLSDPHYASLMKSARARFVLLASDSRLGAPRNLPHRWDIAHLSYPTERRVALLENLRDMRISPFNIWGSERDEVLRTSRLLLNMHQDEFPIMAPLRLAVAASYQLPVVSERVIKQPSAYNAIDFADFDELPIKVRTRLADENWLRKTGEALHHSLCIETNFRTEVLRALGVS